MFWSRALISTFDALALFGRFGVSLWASLDCEGSIRLVFLEAFGAAANKCILNHCTVRIGNRKHRRPIEKPGQNEGPIHQAFLDVRKCSGTCYWSINPAQFSMCWRHLVDCGVIFEPTGIWRGSPNHTCSKKTT